MINLEARIQKYGELETADVTLSAVENGMNAKQEAVAKALDAHGFLALWAKGKGSGFWVKNIGYLSLSKTAKLVGVNLKSIEPAASEPTAEAAQPAHRFPVGAVVVISGSDTECTEQTGIIQERHIGRYGLLQYTVSGQQFRICESELAAL